jgi:ethanolamine permease
MPEQGAEKSSVTYTRADGRIFRETRPARHARVLHLWALGVGAVISGDFFGWNFGLVAGGSVGMFVALAIMTVMYAGLVFFDRRNVARAAAHGGAYSFGEPRWGRGAATSRGSPRTWNTS